MNRTWKQWRMAGIFVAVVCAVPLPASTVPYLNSSIDMCAQPASGSTSITYGGVFTGFDAGCNGGSNSVTGTVAYKSAVNGLSASATLNGATAGSFDSGQLSLGSSASLTTVNSPAGGGNFHVQTDEDFVDDLNVSGFQLETPYVMDFNFDLAGLATATSGSRAWVDVIVNIDQLGTGVGESWTGRFTSGGLVSTATPGNQLVFIKANDTATVLLDIKLRAYVDISTGSGNLSANSDFLDTLALTGSGIANAQGNLISGPLTDTSGNLLTGPSSVPEPSSWLLCALALPLAARFRKKPPKR